MKKIIITKATTTHELILADMLEALDKIKEKANLVFADPPYNIGKRFGRNNKKRSEDEYIDWCKEWIRKVKSLLTNNGAFYIMGATQFIPRLDFYLRENFEVINRIVWYYDSSGVQAKKRFGSQYEPIIFCLKDKNNYTFNYENITVPARTGAVRKLIDYRKTPPQPYNNKRNPGNVWYFPRVRFKMPEYIKHPAQKPELLLERIILASSNKGDPVLDPFAGTFTTNAVAAKLGRRSIGVEIEPEYFEAGVKRVKSVTEGEEIANKKNFGRTPQAIDLYQFSNFES